MSIRHQRRPGYGSIALAVSAVVLIVSAGCNQLTPEQKLQALRAEYTAEVQNFYPVESEIEAAADAGEETAEDFQLAVEPETVAILVDVLVSTTAREKLPGITIDVSHGDSQGNEKELRRIWIDTSALERGSGSQMTLRLEDLDYVEGDGFHVQVRSPIPEQERSEYQEFQSIGE